MSGDDEDAEGDAVASPIPLPRAAPRADQRFAISGHPGLWRLVADGSTGPLDVTRVRSAESVLAALGERLCEFELTTA